MRFQSYFNTAVQLIKAYNGGVPLAHYLKNYFAQQKKHGSKDRKYIMHLCYCFYRLGHAFKGASVEDRLKTAIFLCNGQLGEWSVLFEESWLAGHHQQMAHRISFLSPVAGFEIEQIFPWKQALSAGVEFSEFANSHLIQPDLFLRIRPGKRAAVLEKLTSANVGYIEISETCLALSNSSSVDKVISLDKEAVVQDYSSQQIATFLRLVQPKNNSQLTTKAGGQPAINVWDCCAASGGKSILAVDELGHVRLAVSDIRPSIIHNLQQRFLAAGIQNYTSFVADLSHSPFTVDQAPTKNKSQITNHKSSFTTRQAPTYHKSEIINHKSPFNLVICDAPCTGSGTWGRTPEQLYFFSEEKIGQYSQLQKKIVANVLPYVAKGGSFLYITCSVFKAENEDVADYIQQQGMIKLRQEVLTGYGKKADTMFAALFTTG